VDIGSKRNISFSVTVIIPGYYTPVFMKNTHVNLYITLIYKNMVLHVHVYILDICQANPVYCVKYMRNDGINRNIRTT
jgi:hypothetical protein